MSLKWQRCLLEYTACWWEVGRIGGLDKQGSPAGSTCICIPSRQEKGGFLEQIIFPPADRYRWTEPPAILFLFCKQSFRWISFSIFFSHFSWTFQFYLIDFWQASECATPIYWGFHPGFRMHDVYMSVHACASAQDDFYTVGKVLIGYKGLPAKTSA